MSKIELKITWKGKRDGVWTINVHGDAGLASVGNGIYGPNGEILDIVEIIKDTGGGIGETYVARKKESEMPHSNPSNWESLFLGGNPSEGSRPVATALEGVSDAATAVKEGAKEIAKGAGDVVLMGIGLYLLYLLVSNKK